MTEPSETDRATQSVGSSLTLYASGFNAHHQLCRPSAPSDGAGEDVHAFTPIPFARDHDSIEVFYASWSSTHLLASSPTPRIRHLGTSYTSAGEWQDTPSAGLRSAFGDHEGLIGCLDADGRLFILPSRTGSSGLAKPNGTLVCHATQSSPPLSCIALAGNGRVAMTFKQAPNAKLTHIAEFHDMESCLAYYRDPAGVGNYPDKHHMLGGRPRQLIAGTATFALLMEGGEVLTWGDPRRQSLGRRTIGEEATGADTPGVVVALDGVHITRIACGGWLSAAISEEGAAYIWGAGAPGAEMKMKQLVTAGPGGVVLVELPGEDANGPIDVIDVAVGDDHIVLIAGEGCLYAAGDNFNGQLGVGDDQDFFEDWIEVPSPKAVQRVACGPKATFAFAIP